MMNECKRILNKEVAGEGLWQADLSKCQEQQGGDVLEIKMDYTFRKTNHFFVYAGGE